MKLYYRVELMGFIRETKNGKGVTVSIDTRAFQNAKTYKTKAIKTYVRMIINLAKLKQLLKDEINFTIVS